MEAATAADSNNFTQEQEPFDFDFDDLEGEGGNQDAVAAPDFDEIFKYKRQPQPQLVSSLAGRLFEIQSRPSLLEALKKQEFFTALAPSSKATPSQRTNASKIVKRQVKQKQRFDYNVEMRRKRSPTSLREKIPCIYENCGCREMVTEGSWLEKDHYEECEFRPLPCILSESKCNEEVPYHGYIVHLQTHRLYPNYMSSLTSKVIIRAEEFEQDVSYSPKWISAWSLHFFLHLVRKTPGIWSSWISLYDNGAGLDPSTFLARITYYKELRSVGGIFPVQSLRVDHAEMEKERSCLLTSDETIRAVCQIGENLLTDLSIHLEIVKYTGPPPRETDHDHGVRESGDQLQQQEFTFTPKASPHESKIGVTTSQLDLSTNSATASATAASVFCCSDIASPVDSFNSMPDLEVLQEETGPSPEPVRMSSSASVSSIPTIPSAATDAFHVVIDVESESEPNASPSQTSPSLPASNSLPFEVLNLSDARISEEFDTLDRAIAISTTASAAVTTPEPSEHEELPHEPDNNNDNQMLLPELGPEPLSDVQVATASEPANVDLDSLHEEPAINHTDDPGFESGLFEGSLDDEFEYVYPEEPADEKETANCKRQCETCAASRLHP